MPPFPFFMKCYTPIWLDKQKTYVPCGRCYACQMNHRAEWDLRLRLQNLDSVDSAFVTLTYSDQLVDKIALNKKHIQNYFQSIRHSFRDLKLKYYAIGEYGEKKGRPHYHALIFCSTEFDVNHFHLFWPYGIVEVDPVTDADIHYVTKWHVTPKLPIKNMAFELHGFTLQSKGLGSRLLKTLTIDNIQPYYRFDGNNYPMPRYYRKKLGITFNDPTESLDAYIMRKHPDFSPEMLLLHKQQIIARYNELQLNSKHNKL